MRASTNYDEKEVVYYDTNVWVSYMLGNNDHFYHLCKPLIENIEQKRCIAIVSYPVIMESIHVIRRRVAERQPVRSDANSLESESLAEKRSDDFIKLVKRLAEQKKIVITRPTKNVTAYNAAVLKKLRTLSGYVKLERQCKNCQRPYLARSSSSPCPLCGRTGTAARKYKYRGLGHVDVEHAYLAVYSRASTFYSTDKAFASLAYDPDFNTINFVQLEGRPSHVQIP